ncbi:adenylate/guanylate cyclase domain-containing protein [Paenibacillus sp. YYML68]|uniref:adenylate/guanylate cyclase domain-containing protein n=1 Tax=Paenibacillus sp. YYML68 TaxID=2909250 RepID=UPI00248F7DA1|nr:adenylate/guanylate cyclase domain-containing protein [Paenibacillus sp. YYML68]
MMKPQRYVYDRVYTLPRDKVWELLSRTDHLNRVIGLFPLRKRTLRTNGTQFVQDLQAMVFGIIPLQWTEHPFTWVKEQSYAVVREYHSGPLRRFYGGIELSDAEERLPDGQPATKVRLFAEFTPNGALGMLAIPIVGVQSMRKTLTFLEQSVRLAAEQKSYMDPQTKTMYQLNVSELDRLLAKLADLTDDQRHAVKLLREHLLRTGDDEVVDMRPYTLADRWQADREAVLQLFLHATKAGILNLSWQLLCPNCRVSKAGAGKLSDITPQFHCDFCGIEYAASFDRYVELTFSVHPLIRHAVKQVFCVGGPLITPHIHTQLAVAPGETASVIYPDVKGPMRLRVLRTNETVPLMRNEGEQGSSLVDAQLAYRADGGWSRRELALSAPGSVLSLTNESESIIHVALERADWSDDTVTAAKVSTMQQFRTLFSSEVLAPGQQIGIENVTVLFSDLRGSTAYYEKVGDAHAYSQVRGHFEFLLQHIRANGGAVVKTIGDAVMAVFEYPENAMKAALAIQADARHMNGLELHEASVVIKLGFYHGPAIAVNTDGVLDYFGRTVNLAARTQGLSAGDDIVVSRECTLRLGVRQQLADCGAEIDYFTERLKGIEGLAELARIRLR